MTCTFPHRFSTKHFDVETGLYYYGYRFYSPELMRWLSRDPIQENGGTLLFGFIQNNPLNAADSHGLTEIRSIRGGFASSGDTWVTVHAAQGQDCSGLNFIQVLEYRVEADPRPLQLDPLVAPRWHAPFYYGNEAQLRETSGERYPLTVTFGDRASSALDRISKWGEQAYFTVLIADDWQSNRDHAEVIGAFMWGYKAVEGSDVLGMPLTPPRFRVMGRIWEASDADVDRAIGVLNQQRYDPFRTGTFDVRKSTRYRAFSLFALSQLRDDPAGTRGTYVAPTPPFED
jgi:RHS repeat-associated protein